MFFQKRSPATELMSYYGIRHGWEGISTVANLELHLQPIAAWSDFRLSHPSKS